MLHHYFVLLLVCWYKHPSNDINFAACFLESEKHSKSIFYRSSAMWTEANARGAHICCFRVTLGNLTVILLQPAKNYA